MFDRLFHLIWIAALPLAVGCAPFPDLPGPEGAPGDYPELMPIDELVDQADLGDPTP
jgi:hypothetical protein